MRFNASVWSKVNLLITYTIKLQQVQLGVQGLKCVGGQFYSAQLVGRWNGACSTWVGCCWRVGLASLSRDIGSIHCCFNCVEVRFFLELTDVLLVAYSLVPKPIRDLRNRSVSVMGIQWCHHINLAAKATVGLSSKRVDVKHQIERWFFENWNYRGALFLWGEQS